MTLGVAGIGYGYDIWTVWWFPGGEKCGLDVTGQRQMLVEFLTCLPALMTVGGGKLNDHSVQRDGFGGMMIEGVENICSRP